MDVKEHAEQVLNSLKDFFYRKVSDLYSFTSSS